MTVTQPNLLADLAEELLAAAVDLLGDSCPERQLVSHGEPAADCAEVAVNLVRLHAKPNNSRDGGNCSVVLEATYAVTLWQCVTAVADNLDDPTPEADVLTEEALGLLVDGWALLKGMTRMWVQGSLPGGVPCNQVQWGDLEVKQPGGALAGWRFQVQIDLTPDPTA